MVYPPTTKFWVRVNRTQDFVVGGYIIGGNPFDALVFGYYQSVAVADNLDFAKYEFKHLNEC